MIYPQARIENVVLAVKSPMKPSPRPDLQPPQWRSWLTQWSATDCVMNGIFITAMSLFVRHVFHEPNMTNVCGAVGRC